VYGGAGTRHLRHQAADMNGEEVFLRALPRLGGKPFFLSRLSENLTRLCA